MFRAVLMKKNKRLLFLSLLVLLILPGACTPVHSGPDFGPCIASFQDFAFKDQYAEHYSKFFPDHPWVAVTDIPIPKNSFSSLPIMIDRDTPAGTEIWIGNSHLSPDEEMNIFVVYNTQSGRLSTIPQRIADTNWVVDQLFVSHDGQVWGSLVLDGSIFDVKEVEQVWDKVKTEARPFLSTFNEETQRFELVEGLEIFPYKTVVVYLLDSQDNFWIEIKGEGLYRYAAGADKIEKQIDLPADSFSFYSVNLAPDGSLYLLGKMTDGKFTMDEVSIFHYLPETQELLTMQLPQEPWRIFGGMIVDHKNRIWLGTGGYLDADENWHWVHPDPQAYIDTHMNTDPWSWVYPPTVITETSDGVLWYANFIDDGRGNDGTAWYDPETGEGCVITSEVSNVVEDSQQRLWLVADKKLYMYDRNR